MTRQRSSSKAPIGANTGRLVELARTYFIGAGLPGAVLHVVSKDGTQVCVEHGDLTANTPIMLGSTSKAFTATLLLQLVDDGAVRLDDSVRMFLPHVGLPDDVTLQDLACHTSGIRTDATPTNLLQHQGRHFAYANHNYNLLGQVVSEVSGLPFEQLLLERILKPLAMQQSGCAPIHNGVRGRINLFGWNCPAPQSGFGSSSWIQGPSGGVVASAQDAGQFLSMLLDDGYLNDNQVLSPQAVATMFTTGVHVQGSSPVKDYFGDSGTYGFGWVTKTLAGHSVYTHSGKVPQSTSVVALIPDLGVAFVLMANLGDFLVRTPLLEALASALICELLGLKPDRLPSPKTALPKQAALNLAYAGFLGVSALGWFTQTRPQSRAGSVLYHAILPAVLTLGVRKASQTPWPWLFRFVPDTASVLTTGSLSMVASGFARTIART